MKVNGYALDLNKLVHTNGGDPHYRTNPSIPTVRNVLEKSGYCIFGTGSNSEGGAVFQTAGKSLNHFR